MSTTPISFNNGFSGNSLAASVSSRAVVLPFPQTTATNTPTEPAAPVNASALQAAVEALNRHLSATRTDLSFRIDAATDKVVVSIVDAQTGSVLRQMPSEEALRIARYIEHERLGLVRQQA